MKCSVFRFVFLASLTLVPTGCALLDFGRDDPTDADPVATAAMRVRQGADRQPAQWSTPEYADRIHDATAYGEVIPGMGMKEVRQILGEPYSVDAAGASRDGTERWVYVTQTSGRYGLGGNTRTVYFEQGRVAGWDNAR